MFTKRLAEELNLCGWVRNLWNGDVELIAEGNQTEQESLLVRLREGPRASYVSNIAIEWQPYTGEFHSFQIRINSGQTRN
jgi:acylphosphatase